MTVYGDAPRPRVLFEDVPDEVFEAVQSLAPTWHRLSADDDSHDSDWDTLVTFAPYVTSRSESLHVLSFGAQNLLPPYDSRPGMYGPTTYFLERNAVNASRKCRVVEESPKAVRRLLARTVARNINPNAEKDVWRSHFVNALSVAEVRETVVPWVAIGEEDALYAFEWLPEHQRGLWWVLPTETTEHESWFRLFLKRLREIDVQSVPADPDWRRDPMWAPSPLKDALDQLEVVRAKREQVLADLERRESEASTRVEEELATAAAGAQVLLTGTDEELVRAVRSALAAFGFEVKDMDGAHVDRTGARLEDLRLSLPGADPWTCLVEVKGLTGGPKARDIGQVVQRPAVQFAIDERRPPEKVLLVVNQFRNDPPSTRPRPPIASPERDLAPLAAYDGALIDTRDLFLALRAVESGVVGPDEVRNSIVQAREIWQWEPSSRHKPEPNAES